MLPSEQRVARILADPSASQWLKDALRSAMKRELSEAVRDAEVLLDVLAMRMKEALQRRKF